MLPATTRRVARNTVDKVNERIARRTRDNVARCAAEGPAGIARRLDELEREWDIERTLEANASSLVLIGLGLGTFADRRYLLLPATVAAFLLQHALQGWCPPVPLLRRLGIRTQSEIEQERYALKALKGDFRHTGADTPATGNGARRAMRAADL